MSTNTRPADATRADLADETPPPTRLSRGGMTIALCANGGASSGDLRSLADAVVKAAGPVVVDSSYDLF